MTLLDLTSDKDDDKDDIDKSIDPPFSISPFPNMGYQSTDNIENMLVNMNKQNHSPTLFRDNIIDQLMGSLIGESHPNAILVGAAGTGKTKIVEELANRIETRDPSVPVSLLDHVIYSLQISDIVAGANMVGELEAKVNSIIEFLKDEDNKAILFLDEIHLLFQGDNMYGKIAQILKPSLSRGQIRVIGATTLQEIKRIDNDPAFKRRFTKVIVDELTKEQTLHIINSYIKRLKKHYGQDINYDEKLGSIIIDIADEYCSGHRPDNSITLIDRAVASSIIDKHKLLNSADPDIQAMALSMKGIILSERTVVKTAMRIATGHTEPKQFDEEELRKELSFIKGQDNVIDEIITAIKLRNLHLRPQKKPLTMLFLGDSGVGKSVVTEIIARTCTDEKAISLNMAEFNHESTINRLIGAPAGYVGSDSNAEMPFDILGSNPYQVILLDEFDKAHKSVQNLFMSAFESGYIKNNRGDWIDFSKCVIIATSNAGCMNVTSAIGLNKESEKDVTVTDLSEYFDLALINRFDHRITFNHITRQVYQDIMLETYRKEIQMIKKTHSYSSIPNELDTQTLKELCDKSFNPRLGARPIRSTITEYIDNMILNEDYVA